jgi:hypothetical protein
MGATNELFLKEKEVTEALVGRVDVSVSDEVEEDSDTEEYLVMCTDEEIMENMEKMLTSTMQPMEANNGKGNDDGVEREVEFTMEAGAEMSSESKAMEEQKSEAVDALLQLSSGSRTSDRVVVTSDPVVVTSAPVVVTSAPVVVTSAPVVVTSAPGTSVPTLTTGVWEQHIRKKDVDDFVESLPFISAEQLSNMTQTMREEHGDVCDRQWGKLCVMELLFKKMAVTKAQDKRILSSSAPNETPYIIEAVPMDSDGSTGDFLFFTKNRAFNVHDTLFFNLVIRRVQATHPLYSLRWGPRPTTTRPTQEVLDRLGIGAPLWAKAWAAKKHRGPEDTDPKLICPDTGEKQSGGMRDGLYFRGYVTIPGKAELMLLRHTRNDKRPRPVETDTTSMQDQATLSYFSRSLI